MDSNTLSIIAIIISLGVPAFEYIYNKKMNNVNIDAHYFDTVYDEYLLEKIPMCRMQIEINDDGEVSGIDEFIQVLREIRKKSLYFKFAKEDFYKEIYSHIQNLEDELVMIDQKVTINQFNQFQISIDAAIREIYECISEAAHVKNFFM